LSAVVAFVGQQLPGVTVDWSAVREARLYGHGRPFPIAWRRPEAALDEQAKIRFSRDRLEAYLVLYPAKPRGQRLQEDDVTRLLTAYGIPGHLVNPQAVRMALLRRSHNEPECIARGRPVTDGGPARVQWLRGLPSDPEGFLAAVPKDEQYPEQVLGEVETGAVAGQRTPPDAGTPGVSVTGEALPARPGVDPVHLGGGLTLSPDGRQVVATAGGHLRQDAGARPGARVFPLLHVRDPQELREWSDRVFPGSVIVDGDLELTFPLRVLGDMEVRGSVIRSSLEVMGSLFVRDGVIQQRQAPLRVGGILSAAFFERAGVVAHTVQVRRYSLKSNLLALDRLVAPRRTSLKGGQVACLGSVSVGVLGDRNGIATELLVAHPSLVEPFQATYTEWAEALTPDSGNPTGPRDPLLAEEGDRWQQAAATLVPPEPLEALVVSEAVNPGVTVRIGLAVREMQSTVGPVEMRYERIGLRGRVSLSRL
ncbi:MAG: FapA family protein, partial [Deferrisomatales bacterium]|nr:FapA family protein [Deferrisomatales bacterium]